ncbi:hypothetical protein GLYMA_04G162100v4 [Glycine max]|uniref:Ninja-family protein n=2 Tax=Glycine subgen. Soja TaxID=1462606 RepID=A0A0R0KF87_SOYBN|nr:ninja-family protein 2 isoform X1 [Glycine max]XP_006578539.1 ninja-family protein 2 isoform X1 [Glycine max]XP_028228997.1 ninja-family protein 2-like isoform X1 [Glycine soja]XP_028228999.1 ninja-family protein 2-like isoform X1 [Glycine soja]KAH1111628.1 hypothetical protein GYH30_010132 [Glycine max]KAH1111629.1 hypothetical protein GYH30_010132 [Glycine max]KRH63223.1 hypothetical protein GLYMA_04G162100v4 [Glycine max]KRH63224.1 hypothetical protein GLYMA_04G162100v4 [Glycine max]R|eukprot:XP_006578537.1 ninja-family protein 2 isoform X1 [Glycine max]
MERCYNEKEYKSNKTDLTLKLPPCGENVAEERGLRRSSSSSLVVGVANAAQWGPSLGRSCSLPTERQRRRVAALSPQVLAWVAASSAVNVNNTPSSLLKPKALPNSSQDSGLDTLRGVSYNIPYIGPTHSAEGVASNIQTSTKQENDSMASQKTMAKGISPRPADTKPENPAKKHKLGNYCSLKGDVMEILRRMPSVTTTGDGPNGKRIEGFLYKYRSGQVCIVCVCHGNFLTPAEFVMHAGGKEVANPMKHITVLSNSF